MLYTVMITKLFLLKFKFFWIRRSFVYIFWHIKCDWFQTYLINTSWFLIDTIVWIYHTHWRWFNHTIFLKFDWRLYSRAVNTSINIPSCRTSLNTYPTPSRLHGFLWRVAFLASCYFAIFERWQFNCVAIMNTTEGYIYPLSIPNQTSANKDLCP